MPLILLGIILYIIVILIGVMAFALTGKKKTTSGEGLISCLN